MSEHFQRELPDFRLPDFTESFQHLPGWLADRLLRPDEKVAWVRGPRHNPSSERYLTHPGLFVAALGIGAIIFVLGRLIGGQGSESSVLAFLLAGVVVISSIIVLGLTNGYFTRLVVTNFRLVIVQGYEICRSWDIGKLPPSLLRYGRQGDQESWTVDLDAVKTMLGGSSDKFTDAKTILKFGKQLDNITIRDEERR